MDISLEQWDETIAALYDAILQPELLSSAVARVNQALDSDFCHLLGVTPQGEVALNIVTTPSYQPAIADYRDYYVGIDPRRQFADSQPVGATYRCSSLFTPKFVDRSEFYQDFLKPHGLRYIIGACLHRSDRMSVYAAFNHINGRPEFTDEEHKFFSLLNTHLGKVITAIDRARPVSTAFTLGEHALEAMQIGLMGLAANGVITYANAQAKTELAALALARDGTGRLAEGSPCRLLVQQVLADGMPHGLRLFDSNSVPRFVTALPAPADIGGARPEELSSERTAVIFIFNKPGQTGPRPTHLKEWFGLSGAESRLANALAAGHSIEQYALTYSISVATARTQLRSILKKTGVSRQQELVRLLASLPTV
jgi:DNA-binding CsgD family transcriptional regulator